MREIEREGGRERERELKKSWRTSTPIRYVLIPSSRPQYLTISTKI